MARSSTGNLACNRSNGIDGEDPPSRASRRRRAVAWARATLFRITPTLAPEAARRSSSWMSRGSSSSNPLEVDLRRRTPRRQRYGLRGGRIDPAHARVSGVDRRAETPSRICLEQRAPSTGRQRGRQQHDGGTQGAEPADEPLEKRRSVGVVRVHLVRTTVLPESASWRTKACFVRRTDNKA